LGSNLGDRKKNIKRVLSCLAASPYIKIIKTSSFYMTSPLVKGQRDYINAVVKIKTCMTPVQLLFGIKMLERAMGRRKSRMKWASRIIDLDMLFFSNRVINKPYLKIPHPEIQSRRFVLEPLSEISPGFVHPVMKLKISAIFKELLTMSDQKAKIIR
jgi:2-amino-4-hydroxy-6-hydroxymethyldihydropteridine diphosphokinase